MLIKNDKNDLFQRLSQGACAITPNNRLSANLLQQYFKHHQKTTLVKPFCKPYNTVLTQLYNSLRLKKHQQNYPQLLSPNQSQHLWRQIIQSSSAISYNEGLLNAVTEAWGYCEQWQLSSSLITFEYTPQTQQFQDWWQRFNEELKLRHCISEYQIVAYLSQEANQLPSAELIWVCFDEFTPQQQALQAHFADLGITQYCYDLKEKQTSVAMLAAADQTEEYQQLLFWLQAKLLSPQSRIGVVVPNLQQESKSLYRFLSQHLDSALFNISLGKALSEFALVSHALCWLGLEQNCNAHQAALLLQSPFIGGAKTELMHRSQYLQDSYLLQNLSFSLKEFKKDIQSLAPILAKQLDKLTSYPQKASPQQWVELFHARLNLLGFPGDEGLNSENYQCYNRFLALLDEFQQLQCVSVSFSAQDALDNLALLCNNTIFQAQKTNAPIQISGLLEASGCEFDSLWMVGLTDQCLPQKTRLSAFIPQAVQKELNMPHSSADRELVFAQKTLQRLQRGCAADFTVSFPWLQGDNPNLPCSLIVNYPQAPHLMSQPQALSVNALVERDENYLVQPFPGEEIPGGTALLGNQAKCPFKAFAQHRLNAKPLLETIEGIDAKEKGKVIHKVMELIWLQLHNQASLFKLADEALERLVEQCVEQAMQNTPTPQSLLQSIEKQRLKRVALACLDWEKQRESFEVDALEQAYTFRIGHLAINIRVDRLDKVGNKKWVIDYKSALPLNKPWNEERPKEPQLLLYALLDEDINTLLFLQIKTGQIACSGLSEEKQDIRGLSILKKNDTWPQQRELWQQQLALLAEEIQQGLCTPTPASSSICQFCDFSHLCRIGT